jgi:hypothetical protein
MKLKRIILLFQKIKKVYISNASIAARFVRLTMTEFNTLTTEHPGKLYYPIPEDFSGSSEQIAYQYIETNISSIVIEIP